MSTLKQKQELLNKIYEPYICHTHCPLGLTEEHNVIFGSGNINTKLMIIGEAPGKTEEEQGLPFVGRSGKLFTQILKSFSIDRDDIFITNIVKCRPQNNRTPSKKEVAAYKNLLLKQIDIIQPKVICTLGATAAQALLPEIPPITKSHGTLYWYNKIAIIPTYHPAYILRNSKNLPFFTQDLKKSIDLAFHL